MGLIDRLRRSSHPAPAPRETLFDDDFQRKLEMLAIVSRRVFTGRMRAERRSKKKGSGVEFADHRDYVPGDDFRYVDWNVYQRFGSNWKYVRVSLSEASHPLMLDMPTMSPPQPPVTHVACDSPTGNVRLAKKSLPAMRAASNRTS